jgi:hypothetical protein
VHAAGKVLSIVRFLDLSANVLFKETEKLLERLPGWNLNNVRFDELKACLHGTRQKLLDDVRAWVHSPGEMRMLWLSGGAGTGKSSIANSVAMFFEDLGRLGACFRFSRDTSGLNSPENLFGNLCYQLAHFDDRLKNEILSGIKRMGHVAGSSLRTQAKKLIVETANAAKLLGPVVLVIDALDEAGTSEARKVVLSAMAAESSTIPDSLRIIVTSRDEGDIRTGLQDCSKEMRIEECEGTVEDIAVYVDYRLRQVTELSDRQRKQAKEKVCDRAGQLFIWASVACNFIAEARDPALQLRKLLHATDHENRETQSALVQLDALYCGVLKNAITIRDLKAFRYVVGSILALERPLSQIELDSLLGLGDESANYAVRLPSGDNIHLSSSAVIINSLQSILRTDPTAHAGTGGAVRLLHPSLYDFLTSRAEDDYRIDVVEQNGILAVQSLKVLNAELCLDICRIGNPSLLNEEVEDLPQRIDGYMSGGLQYSCHSFAYHLGEVSEPSVLVANELNKFAREHLLHWIEAMSLLGKITRAEYCLQVLTRWMRVSVRDVCRLRWR